MPRNGAARAAADFEPAPRLPIRAVNRFAAPGKPTRSRRARRLEAARSFRGGWRPQPLISVRALRDQLRCINGPLRPILVAPAPAGMLEGGRPTDGLTVPRSDAPLNTCHRIKIESLDPETLP